MLVDEYQDTNVAQYLWLRLLAQARKNICCVGDDDQSIYGWRGAEVDNILRFEHDFPGATVIRLERNYRSTGHILAAASGLIANNEGRLGKTLSHRGRAGREGRRSPAPGIPRRRRASSARRSRRCRPRGIRLTEIAILVRISAQMREIEDRFVTLGLPYRVIGGPRFYERAEIRDALAYLRCIVSPPTTSPSSASSTCRSAASATRRSRCCTTMPARPRVPLMAGGRAFVVETDELKPKPRADAARSSDRLRPLGEAQPRRMTHTELAADCAGGIRLHRHVAEGQIGRCAPGGSRTSRNSSAPWRSSRTCRASWSTSRWSWTRTRATAAERVSLMTLHAAKGLEFDTVFLPGWEEGLFPNQRTLDESGRAGLEEERRLAYVGLTRARRARQDLLRLEPPHPRPVAIRPLPCASSTICQKRMSRSSRRPRTSLRAAMAAARASTAWRPSVARPTRRRAGSAPRPMRAGGDGSAAHRAAPATGAARC